MPDTPPRLDIIFQKYDPALFFVTFNTYHRKKLLCSAQVHEEFLRFAKLGEERGIAIGRYVLCLIMLIFLLAVTKTCR